MGDAWCSRGFFALLEPTRGTASAAAAYALAIAALLCGLYMLSRSVVLLHPRKRHELDLAGRLMGANGLLLVMTLTAYLLFLREPTGMAIVSYLTLSYAPLMFGLAHGLATLVLGRPGWLRTVGRVGTALLLLLMGIGWGQSGLHTMRALDRPDVQRVDFRTISRVALLSVGDAEQVTAEKLKSVCLEVHPGNEAFCSVVQWQDVMAPAEFAGSREDIEALARSAAELCLDGPDDALIPCAMAAGARRSGDVPCPIGPQVPSLAPRCDGFEGQALQACLAGVYRGPVFAQNTPNHCSLTEAIALCDNPMGDPVPTWQQRACLEGAAMMLTGMPPLPPGGPEAASGACAGWPVDWRGLCRELGRVRKAGLEDVTCEQVYLERFADTVPARNSLIYQQCAYADIMAGWHDLYPPCAIGVAKALEGLSCFWAGSELHL